MGFEIAKNFDSPKAMSRMVSYLHEVNPKSVELVVDEMLVSVLLPPEAIRGYEAVTKAYDEKPVDSWEKVVHG